MAVLTFALNVILDGCCDHREGIADEELHDFFTALMDSAGAMLWGRKLEDKPKYVVSASRSDFPWKNTFRVEGELREGVTLLKEKTPRGVLVGSPMLSLELERLGLIDEYRVVVRGPTLFQGLERSRRLELLATTRFSSGVMAMHYRRKEG